MYTNNLNIACAADELILVSTPSASVVATDKVQSTKFVLTSNLSRYLKSNARSYMDTVDNWTSYTKMTVNAKKTYQRHEDRLY